jgi:hypothetical protein
MDEQKNIIEEYKKFYKNIGSIACSYFDGESVYFNRKGFNHLLRKGKHVRSYQNQVDRLQLLKFSETILTGDYSQVIYRITRKNETLARFWGFESLVGKSKLMLVATQINEGRKYFFSIYKIQNTP